MKKLSEKAEKTVYAILAIATFFLIWAFITTFTTAGESTPGPIEVLKLLFSSIFEPIGKYTIYGHLYCGVDAWDRSGNIHGNFQICGSDHQTAL